MITIPGKIPIYISPIFWVVALGIGFLSSFNVFGMVVWAAVIFCSLIVHEMGHALTAVYFRQKAVIRLVAFGGVTQRQGPPTKLWQDFLIVLNGPLAGFALFVVAYLLLQRTGVEKGNLWTSVLLIFAYINFIWTVINLLPVQPLDGGQMLRIICESAFGYRGVRYALFIGMVIAFATCFAFFAVRFLIGGILFLLFGVENYRMWRSVSGMTSEDYHHPLEELLQKGKEALDAGHYVQAEEHLRHLYEQTQKGILHTTSGFLLAHALVEQGGVEEPYRILITLHDDLGDEAAPLLHSLATKMEDWKVVDTLGKKAYQMDPGASVATANAYAAAAKGDAKGAVGWLQCALQEGEEKMGLIIQSANFEPIRRDALFQEFAAQYRA